MHEYLASTVFVGSVLHTVYVLNACSVHTYVIVPAAARLTKPFCATAQSSNHCIITDLIQQKRIDDNRLYVVHLPAFVHANVCEK